MGHDREMVTSLSCGCSTARGVAGALPPGELLVNDDVPDLAQKIRQVFADPGS
jgi:hypothetical protein